MATENRKSIGGANKRASVIKTHDDRLFAWSWAAPIPQGQDPASIAPGTNHAEVAEWLKSEGLDQYAPLFKNHNVSGAEVPFLTTDQLKEIGVTKVGHQLRLQKAAKAFKRTLKNWERNETIMECQNWHLRPRACIFFPTKFRFTPAAIVVYDPEPCV